MKIVICWSNISGYMASCWRALSSQEGVELFVLAFESSRRGNTQFSSHTMQGINHVLLDQHTRFCSKTVCEIVSQQSPDVLMIPGWFHKPYRDLVYNRDFKLATRIMVMDTNLKMSMRQVVGRLKLRSYVQAFDYVFVPGERAWQMARFLGVQRHKIYRGAYGCDCKEFFRVIENRLKSEKVWPRSFLFVGQYIERKGLDLLIEAYRRFREEVTNPWPLYCCGKGPLTHGFKKSHGVKDYGFIQASELPSIMSEAGVFVFPSRYDAWGVALVEACAAGLPVICTEECGASVEVVRSLYNGISIPSNSVEALSEALLWMHRNYSKLPLMGKRSRDLAQPFASEYWADRVMELCRNTSGR